MENYLLMLQLSDCKQNFLLFVNNNKVIEKHLEVCVLTLLLSYLLYTENIQCTIRRAPTHIFYPFVDSKLILIRI